MVRLSRASWRRDLVQVLVIGVALFLVIDWVLQESTVVTSLDADPSTTGRLDEQDPVDLAVAVSRQRFAQGTAARGVLVGQDSFEEALLGVPLLDDGPLLYSGRFELPDATLRELRRALPDGAPVYVIGNLNLIARPVANQLRAEGFEVRRLEGEDDVALAVAVAEAVYEVREFPTAVLVRGDAPRERAGTAWADAVGVSGWAAQQGAPVLPTPSDGLPEPYTELIGRLGLQASVLVGGEDVLSPAVANAVPRPQRVAGPDRAATAVAAAQTLYEDEPDSYVVVNGFRSSGWRYGLPAAGLAADEGAPVVLVDTGSVPDTTRDLLSVPCGEGPALDLLLIGSPLVIEERVRRELDLADAGACGSEVVTAQSDTAPAAGLPRNRTAASTGSG